MPTASMTACHFFKSDRVYSWYSDGVFPTTCMQIAEAAA
jgi:hypothetical protein